MKVGDLKKALSELPDDAEVTWYMHDPVCGVRYTTDYNEVELLDYEPNGETLEIR